MVGATDEQRAAIKRLSAMNVDATIDFRSALRVIHEVAKSVDYVSIIAAERNASEDDSAQARLKATQVRRDLRIAERVLIEVAQQITKDHLLANNMGRQEIDERMAALSSELHDLSEREFS